MSAMRRQFQQQPYAFWFLCFWVLLIWQWYKLHVFRVQCNQLQMLLKWFNLQGGQKCSDGTWGWKYAGSRRPSLAEDQVLPVPVPQVSEDIPNEPLQKWKGGKWDRKTFKIVVSYDGSTFTGWQRQPGLYTVQGYDTLRVCGFSVTWSLWCILHFSQPTWASVGKLQWWQKGRFFEIGRHKCGCICSGCWSHRQRCPCSWPSLLFLWVLLKTSLFVLDLSMW